MLRAGDLIVHDKLHKYMADVAQRQYGTSVSTHLDLSRQSALATEHGRERERAFAITDKLYYWTDNLLGLQPKKLGGMRLERSLGQIKFHTAVLPSVVSSIFGSALLAECREELEYRYGITDFTPCTSILAPRRFGKSLGMAVMVAAVLLAVPNFVVVLASITKRVSAEMMNTIKDLLSHVPGFAEQIDRDNAENLRIVNPEDPTDYRHLRCVPGHHAKCRGIKAKWILLDEADFMDAEFFVLNARGQDVVKTVHIGGKCDACLLARAAKCPHNALFMPAHITSTRRDMVKLLMTVASSPDLIEQELDAAFTDCADGFLPTAAIRGLEKSMAWKPSVEYIVDQVFLIVDPSFGGASRTSFIGVFYLPRVAEFVVATVAAEVILDPGARTDFLGRCVSSLLRAVDANISGSTNFVIIVEANQPIVAADVNDGLKKALLEEDISARHILTYMRPGGAGGGGARGELSWSCSGGGGMEGGGGGGIPGALKTEQTTHAMFRLLRDALNNRRIFFHHNMRSPTKGVSAEDYIRQLCMELRRMRIERNRKLVNGIPSESYVLTGKGKSLSENDDCAVALAMAAYYPVLWRAECKF